MKNYFYLLLFFLFLEANAQNNLKNIFFFKPGSILSYDNYSSKDKLILKDFNLELSYQREIFDRLSVELIYAYIRHNFMPKGFSRSEFRNDILIDEFLRTSDAFFTEYEIQDNHFFGTNIHYSFVNNNKWYASFYAGMGYSWWTFNGVFVSSYAFGAEENFVQWRREERNDGHYFSQVGFQVNYTFNKKYVLGVQPSWIFVKSRFESSGPTISNPTAPSVLYDPINAFLRLNLLLGYRF